MDDSEAKDSSSEVPLKRRVHSLKQRFEFASSTGTPFDPDVSDETLANASARRQQQHLLPPLTPRSPLPPSFRLPFESLHSYVSTPPLKQRVYHSCELTRNVNEVSNAKDSSTGSAEKVKLEENTESAAKREELTEVDGIVANSEGEKSPSAAEASIEAESVQISSCTHTPPQLHSFDSSAEHVLDEILDKVAELSTCSQKKIVTVQEEEEAEQSNSNDKKNSRLPYSVSFHRKQFRQRQKEYSERETADFSLTPTHSLSSLSISTNNSAIYGSGQSDASNNSVQRYESSEYRSRLEKRIKTQEEILAQAAKALKYCEQRPEFSGSREELYETLKAELNSIQLGKTKIMCDPLGKITFHHIIVKLVPNFTSLTDPSEIFYFVALLKCDNVVECSRVVSSDEGLHNELSLDMAVGSRLSISNLSPNFVASIEIFVLKSQREKYSHAEKFNLSASSSSKLSSNVLGMVFEKSKNRSLSRSLGRSLAEHKEEADEFHFVGRVSVDIRTRSCDRHPLLEAAFPLTDLTLIKFKREPLTHSSVTHRGFLSIYQRTADGNPSWMRYWCSLGSSELRFWSAPEDEAGKKESVVLLDLCTVTAESVKEFSEAGSYPNSFTIEVWVPKEERSKNMDKLRVMLAADTQTDLQVWMSCINQVTYENSLWRGGHAHNNISSRREEREKQSRWSRMEQTSKRSVQSKRQPVHAPTSIAASPTSTDGAAKPAQSKDAEAGDGKRIASKVKD